MAEISLRSILPDRRLRVASHIRVWRPLGYYHHGIYIGRYEVIHFSGLSTNLADKAQARIIRAPLQEFAGASKIEVVEYEPPPTFSRDEIVARANERVSESEQLDKSDYHVFLRNCEHFATWCVTGKWKSKQAGAVVLGGLSGLLFHHLID